MSWRERGSALCGRACSVPDEVSVRGEPRRMDQSRKFWLARISLRQRCVLLFNPVVRASDVLWISEYRWNPRTLPISDHHARRVRCGSLSKKTFLRCGYRLWSALSRVWIGCRSLCGGAALVGPGFAAGRIRLHVPGCVFAAGICVDSLDVVGWTLACTCLLVGQSTSRVHLGSSAEGNRLSLLPSMFRAWHSVIRDATMLDVSHARSG